MYDIQLSAIIFRFNPATAEKLEVGVVEDDVRRLWLPTIKWHHSVGMEQLVRHHIRSYLVIDDKWLQTDLMCVSPFSDSEITIFWRTQIPDTVKVLGKIDWINYDGLEIVAQRFVRNHLKALRFAYNRK